MATSRLRRRLKRLVDDDEDNENGQPAHVDEEGQSIYPNCWPTYTHRPTTLITNEDAHKTEQDKIISKLQQQDKAQNALYNVFYFPLC